MKIGLFGGTFDPPHIGHLRIAEAFYAASDVDLMLIMPSFIPPHKAASATDALYRFEMCRIAFAPLGEKGVCYRVDDYEITRDDTSYTYLTVRHLLKQYGVDLVSLCVGSDMLMSFERWRCADELMKKCVLYTMARDGGEDAALREHAAYLRDTFGAVVHIMDVPYTTVSSTAIRAALAAEDGAERGLIGENVVHYAREHGLYTV